MDPPTEVRHAKRERDDKEHFNEEDRLNAVKHRRSLSDLLSKYDDEAVFTAENLDYDQELISGVMKSLAEEITGSSSATVPSSETLTVPCFYGANNAIHIASDENVCNVAPDVDLEYLLGATDDELGIPPSPNVLAENETLTLGLAAENPAEDLFENPRAEPQVEGIPQFCDSDCWYLPYEYEASMYNESLSHDCQTRSLEGDAMSDCYGSLSMDKTRMQRLLESGAGM